jgi:hypothetical protein
MKIKTFYLHQLHNAEYRAFRRRSLIYHNIIVEQNLTVFIKKIILINI